MKMLFSPTLAVLSIYFSLAILDMNLAPARSTKTSVVHEDSRRIQVAILLDVSGSMQGLIEQAKSQLWNMVSVMGKVKCDQGTPRIEIALYEYGRTTNDASAGYIKQISGFTSDLDQLSQELFQLNTNGGDEYCGHVILTSLNELRWDTSSSNYKVIFIAGNEDFLQGNVTWTEACKEAARKGVIVNTIYCGDKMQGLREHWNLAGECGEGTYTNIDHNHKSISIPTPYDSALFLLNDNLNDTYLPYGYQGTANYAKQGHVDKLNASMEVNVMAERIKVKGNKQLYSNTAWDLVDAYEKDSLIVKRLDKKSLPDSLSQLTATKLEKLITVKSNQRAELQKQIGLISTQREAYIQKELKKQATENPTTLETEMEKIIRDQVKRFNMFIP
jgi:hypothetical protein